MLNIIFIIIGVLINAICIWSLKILLSVKTDITRKHCLKYFAGITAGIALSLLITPIFRPLHMQPFGGS